MRANVELYKGHIKHLSEEAITKYLQNELSSEEMHAIERHTLDCALCADALEGLENSQDINIASTSKSLQQKLNKRTSTNRNFVRLSIAASISVLLMFSIFYWSDQLSDKDEMAFSPKTDKLNQSIKKDVDKSAELVDSNFTKRDKSEQADIQEFYSVEIDEEEEVSDDDFEREVVKQIIAEDEDKDLPLVAMDDQTSVDEEMDLTIDELADDELAASGAQIANADVITTAPSPINQIMIQRQKRAVGTSFSSKAKNTNQTGQEQFLTIEEKSAAQQDSTNQKTGISRLPEPIGGHNKYKDYLSLSVKHKYPKKALRKKIEGEVRLMMNVTSEGSIEELKVAKSLGYGCDEVAKDLILNGPSWRTGYKNGERISMPVEIVVIFELP